MSSCRCTGLQSVALLLLLSAGLSGQTSNRNVDPAALNDFGKQRSAKNMASTYVPLDSWVYPAFDRLAALGYIQTDFVSLRPWTRMECARLLQEASDRVGDGESDSEAATLYKNLTSEFAVELRREDGAANLGIQIESIYAQAIDISGQPLTDGYHFAQTIVNNFGRPYGEGANLYSGAAVRAQTGWFALYVRGEYQRSGDVAPSFSPCSAECDCSSGIYPYGRTGASIQCVPFSATRCVCICCLQEQPTVLWQTIVVVGTRLRWTHALQRQCGAYHHASLRPRQPFFGLPSFLGVLGPMRLQFFIGQLSGQQFVNVPVPGQPGLTHVIGQSGVSLNPQPYIHGLKLSLNPTPNLELSVSRTVIFGGPGFPVTLGSFWHSFVATGNSTSVGNDPGDRRVAFDFKYRIPGLRDWLTLYCDSSPPMMEAFPVAYPTHSAWSPGIYLPKLPYLHKVDFRAEGAVTPDRLFPGFFYFNDHFLSGYTNDRELMGSWIGREGSGFQLWSTYWLSARTTVQVNYRNMWVDHSFLQGGSVQDFGVTANVALSSELSLKTSAQYERWRFPLLAAGAVSNVTTSLQLSYSPRWGTR